MAISAKLKVYGLLSNVEPTSLSIVQGSGIGPILYAFMKSDLHTLSDLNDIFKYADDTIVLVPEHTNVDLADEFAHVKVWTSINRLMLNFDKTKEIVFRRPRAQDFHMPPMIDDIEQLNCCKLLGVIFQHNLKMDLHI